MIRPLPPRGCTCRLQGKGAKGAGPTAQEALSEALYCTLIFLSSLVDTVRRALPRCSPPSTFPARALQKALLPGPPRGPRAPRLPALPCLAGGPSKAICQSGRHAQWPARCACRRHGQCWWQRWRTCSSSTHYCPLAFVLPPLAAATHLPALRHYLPAPSQALGFLDQQSPGEAYSGFQDDANDWAALQVWAH